MYDPWFKTTMRHSALGQQLKMQIPHDVFSTQRIDEGTLLLLENLPAREPATILDMGCGYGALGLPIAARFKNARLELVDRDLLAAKWSGENARANGLSNVDAYGSLGYRDLKSSGAAYDWILCNVPARIGRPFIESLLGAGRLRLTPEGDLRVVVINDLVPMLLELKVQHSWPLVEVARGPRHSIFSLTAAPGTREEFPESKDLYLRDRVEVGGLALDRPFDLGGDDPKRLAHGLPALLDSLPKQFTGKVLCFRSGYGQLPLVSRGRWPNANVVAVDRDLLGTTYVRRNAERLGLSGERLDVREAPSFPEAIQDGERFDLILGEFSSSTGEKVVEHELKTIAKSLTHGGQALLLCLEKLNKESVKPAAARSKVAVFPLLMREGYVVLSIRGI